MTYELKNTTSAQVARWLEGQRTTDGTSTLGRVLTLIAVCHSEEAVASTTETVLRVSRAHPARIIIVLADPDGESTAGGQDPETPEGENTSANLDANLFIGEDATMAEIVVLRPTGGAGSNQASLVMPLLLPDCPVITWWVDDAPVNPSATPLGEISQRRITTVNSVDRPLERLHELAAHHTPGDTDLAWAGLTIWRGHCAALIDEPPHLGIDRVEVTGNLDRGGSHLMAAWLGLRLNVEAIRHPGGDRGIDDVTICREDGSLEINRPRDAEIAYLRRPGRADLQVPMPMRTDAVMLIEELRTLGDDVEYGEVLTKGLELLDSRVQ